MSTLTYMVEQSPQGLEKDTKSPDPLLSQEYALTYPQRDGVLVGLGLIGDNPEAPMYKLWISGKTLFGFAPAWAELNDRKRPDLYLGEINEPFPPEIMKVRENLHRLVSQVDQSKIGAYLFVVRNRGSYLTGIDQVYTNDSLEFLQGILSVLGWDGKDKNAYIVGLFDKSLNPLQTS